MRNKINRWCLLFAVVLALCLIGVPARAADGDDPSSRAARLSYSSGAVSFEPAGTEDWVDAVVNRPMTVGDKLWADQNSRAEVRIDAYALRLGPQTGFSFLNVDDNVVQVRLTEGALNVRVRRLDDNQTLEIDTPNLAFNVLRAGSYRIDVNENGDATLVTVREGQGEVTGGGSAYPIRAGESANFSGTDQLSADVEGIAEGDDFDQWSESRDRRWENSASARYVSDEAVGYEDLDEYGGWNSVPEYGTVWFPRGVAGDWAPYRYGHWAWISPWGWTWVDDAPWGFAPFHYGRWVVVSGRWGWVPCPPRPAVTVGYVRPVYAPALVAWVGGGVGVGVAWFPLGPRDVYVPSYHVSERYVERVNVTNTTIVNRTQITNVYNTVYVNKTVNVTNITYQNQRANNAVTATSQASFTSAQPVARNQVRVDQRQIASAPVAPVVAVAPQPHSFVGAAAPAKARPPAAVVTRNVVAKTAPPPPPAPVAQQVKAIQANGGRPPSVNEIRASQPEPARVNVKVAAPAKTAALPPKGNSVNRPGQPGRPPQNERPAQQQNANRPANENPNAPKAENPNRPQPAQPNANRSTGNPNRPEPAQPNANRANPAPNPPSAENPNRPSSERPPNANKPPENPNRSEPAQPNANRPNANPNPPTSENPNRPPNAAPNRNETNQPNASRPAENRPPTNERPPAARENPPPQQQQRAEQQRAEQQRAEQQRAEQQRAEQQRAEQQRAEQHQQQRQDVQHQPQQKPQTKEQQQKEQQNPPKENKDNKENKEKKEKDKKDRPPSR